MTVVLDGHSLRLDDVEGVARRGERVALAEAALERMRLSRERVQRVLDRGEAVYGLTTGLGQHKRHRVDPSEAERFNRRLIDTHRVGQGLPAAPDVARATMLRLANGFARGTVGVRPLLAERLVDALNAGATPLLRSVGSVGLSDLAPLADLAHAVFGDVALEANEGLALVNSNAFSTAMAALALTDTSTLLRSLTISGALELEAFGANLGILVPAAGEARPFAGSLAELADLRAALAGSRLGEPGAARNLQDPLAFRSIVQVHGAARDALGYALVQLGTELNAHQHNPLVLDDRDEVVSGSSFEVLALSAALDFVRIALAPALTSAVERTAKLLQSPHSGLPGGLTSRPGPGGGLGEMLWTAHALAVEARLLAQPVSHELATTTGEEGIADRITSAPLSARRLDEQVGLGHRILAIGLVCSAQAVDLRGGGGLGVGTGRLHAAVRARQPFVGADTAFPADLEPLVELVRGGLRQARPTAPIRVERLGSTTLPGLPRGVA